MEYKKYIKNLKPSFILNIAFSSAVIAALITSLLSFKAMKETNRQLIKLEKMRISADINAFRYTKIYLALEEIQNLPVIDYTYTKKVNGKFVQDQDLLKKVMEQTTERHNRILALYDKVKALINTKLVINIDSEIKEEERQTDILTRYVYSNQPLPQDLDVVTLSKVRRKIEDELKRVLAIQISALTGQIQQETLDQNTSQIYPQPSTTTESPKKSTSSVESDKSIQVSEKYIKNLGVWSPVNTKILIDGVKFMEIDHNSGFDYATKYDIKIPISSRISFVSKGFKITKSLEELCRFREEKCNLRIGKSPNDDIQITHEEYISSFGDESELPSLLETLLTNPNSSARAWSANSLGKIGNKSAVSGLVKALKDKDVWVKANAAKALAEIGDTSTLNEIKLAYNNLNETEKSSYGYMFEAAIEALQNSNN
jgi:hypothetical protein